MCDHRRNRHPQLSSPARDSFSPVRHRVSHEVPSPSRSFAVPGFYQALPSSAFGHPPPARHDATFDRGTATSTPWHPGAPYRESPPHPRPFRYLQAPMIDTRESGIGRDTFPGIIPGIERDPSTRSASPGPPMGGGSWRSSPPPHTESLASRCYSHDGTNSPLGPRLRALETPRYVSAPHPPLTSPSSGIPGVLGGAPAALLPLPPPPRRMRPTPSPPPASRVTIPPPDPVSTAERGAQTCGPGSSRPRTPTSPSAGLIARAVPAAGASAGTRRGPVVRPHAVERKPCGYCRAYHRD
ncbi:hypothetical protein LZ30DRAFT_776340 [Colletotrichum cereale]|nr:hypothetical protein LZ30DRAFT_776340 [Colletotrichum cereale]